MMNSEQYILQKINERKEAKQGYYTVPNIPNKILINAANKIAENINPTTVIAVFDNTIFGSGKEGIVFTGTALYIKEALGSPKKISFDNIKDVKFEVERVKKDNGSEKKIEKLTITYDSGEKCILKNPEFLVELEFLSQLLGGMVNSGEDIALKENNHIVTLSELDDNIIALYIRIITSYLKSDDGIIDCQEYKELISLMSRIKVSKGLSNELRENRLSVEKSDEDIIELVNELKHSLDKNNVDSTSIFQSLTKDLLSIRKENLENWQKDIFLCRILGLIGINEKQVNALAAGIKNEKRIVEERLEDKQIKELASEVVAVAGGAGVTLAALAVTGGISSGIWGGLITLGMMSTGGMILGLAAIGSAGYGVYKGIKYFSGTGELEKSGIRIAALQTAIENNKAAVTYIIEDINWLNDKIYNLTDKIKNLSEENKSIMDAIDELMQCTDYVKSVGEAGDLIEKSTEKNNYEINISSIPKKLSIGRYKELVNMNPNRDAINEYIFTIYKETTISNDGNAKTIYERDDDIPYDDADKVYRILSVIGYYDTKASAAAQSQAVLKKGVNTIKGIFGG